MALKKCKECGHEISTKAKTCPNCGASNKSSFSTAGIVLISFFGVILVFLLIGNWSDESHKTSYVGKKSTATSQDKPYKPTSPKFEILEYIVNTPTLNIRSEPTKDSTIIAKLKMGDSVYIKETENTDSDWWKIKSLEGYVAKKYLIAKTAIGSAKRNIEIIKFNWTNSYGIAKFNIKIKNTSPWDIKDVQFVLEYFAPSGTPLGTGKETAYITIPAGKTKTVTVDEIAHSQATRASVGVFKAKWHWEASEMNLDL